VFTEWFSTTAILILLVFTSKDRLRSLKSEIGSPCKGDTFLLSHSKIFEKSIVSSASIVVGWSTFFSRGFIYNILEIKKVIVNSGMCPFLK
jgi:hypothetical protein